MYIFPFVRRCWWHSVTYRQHMHVYSNNIAGHWHDYWSVLCDWPVDGSTSYHMHKLNLMRLFLAIFTYVNRSSCLLKPNAKFNSRFYIPYLTIVLPFVCSNRCLQILSLNQHRTPKLFLSNVNRDTSLTLYYSVSIVRCYITSQWR